MQSEENGGITKGQSMDHDRGGGVDLSMEFDRTPFGFFATPLRFLLHQFVLNVCQAPFVMDGHRASPNDGAVE